MPAGTTITYYISSKNMATDCESDRVEGTVKVNPLPAITEVTASPTEICSGESSTLTIKATGATEYSFDNGENWQETNTKSVSPATTKSYTAKVKNTTGCVSSETVTVTVNSLPAVPKVTSIEYVPGTAVTETALSTAMVGEARTGETWQWYTVATGGTAAPNPKAITADMPAGTATTYYISSKSNATDCESVRIAGTVSVRINPANLDPGTGSLSGRTCFDIAQSNFGDACGDEASRQVQKANFTLPDIYVQTYTFKATTDNVRDVRFVVVDNADEGCVDYTSDLKPMEGALTNGSSVSLTVNYKQTLNNADSKPLIRRRDRQGAAVVTIYVVYWNGSQDVSVPLTVKIQDCMCCGAMVSPTEWKAFMCHNLGADESADPFTPAAAIHGAKYQWGRKTPALTQAEDQAINGKVSGWYSGLPASDAWQDGGKTDNDPCPPGWRVPTHLQWEGVVNNNPSNPIGKAWNGKDYIYYEALLIGSSLLLPAAGRRDDSDGHLINRGVDGDYWDSTTWPGDGRWNDNHEWYAGVLNLLYQGAFAHIGNSSGGCYKSGGKSVRCVSE
jgi:hypothetical protein